MAGLLFANYGGQQVRVDDAYKQDLADLAAKRGMSAMEYDKTLNPDTYGARWGVPAQTTPARTTPTPPGSSGGSGGSSTSQSSSLLSSTPVKSVAPNAPQAIGYNASTADAAKALAQGYTASKVNIAPESTVQGQLSGILSSGSPLNTMAETYALQQANRRGLLNSSIAVGAAQDAVIRNALPIAQQDANTFANAATFNAGAENASGQFGAAAQNTAELQNAQSGTQVNLANAQARNTAAQFKASAINNAALTDVENKMRLQLADLQANTQMSISDKQVASNQIISQGDNQTRLLLNQMDNASRLSLAQLDQDTKIKIAQMDTASKTSLSELEANNRQLLQTNVNAANMFNQYVTNLANISTNTNMDATAKQTAMNNQLNALNAGLQAIGSISGLNLSQYFQAADIDANQPSQPAATNQPPALTIGNNAGGV